MNVTAISAYISIVSGVMTIFGISGIISWGFKNHNRNGIADSILNFFVYSVKFFISSLIFGCISITAYMLKVCILLIFESPISANDVFWQQDHLVLHIVSSIIVVSLCIPFFLLLSACVYSWSFSPLKIFFDKFRNRG